MRKLYEALSVDVVKFEARDVITASGIQASDVPIVSNPFEEPGTPEPVYSEAPVYPS